MPSTLRFHRVLRASPEVVFKAFTDADALAKWLPPPGMTGRVHRIDAVQGGSYAMSFTSLAKGDTHSWQGTFAELIAHQRIVLVERFDDHALAGEMSKTITLNPVPVGTELHLTHAGLSDVIPADEWIFNWQRCLNALVLLVEG